MTDQTTQDTGGVTPQQAAAAAYAANTPDEAMAPTGPAGPAPTEAPADPVATGDGTETSRDAEADQGEEEALLDPEERAAEDGRTPGQLLEALESAEQERGEYLDALQRSRAEFDNFRRRSAREAAGARQAGVGDLAAKLLDVLDDLDRTVEVATTSQDEGLAGGVQAIQRKLLDALVAAGVERVAEADVPFDATRHEAVQQVPAEEPVDEPEVAQVLRPGYLHGDRVLRAAMVTVRQ